MTDSLTPNNRWRDFSGAPPMLIPQSLAPLWRGTTEPATGKHRDLDTEHPVTDYDRACAAACPGKVILKFRDSAVLIFYSEFDWHSWDEVRWIAASGGWFPNDNDIERAKWTAAIRWRAEHTDYYLMNSAADAVAGLHEQDFLPVQLPLGDYFIEFADIAAKYVGGFHRFIRNDLSEGTA